jgi:hypothetical protein
VGRAASQFARTSPPFQFFVGQQWSASSLALLASLDAGVRAELVVEDVVEDHAGPRLALGKVIVELGSNLAHLDDSQSGRTRVYPTHTDACEENPRSPSTQTCDQDGSNGHCRPARSRKGGSLGVLQTNEC